ncbi:uncharacterized protein CC84DRAFT_1174896 [Paraphaeosphaeria sporulosa]|uniref:Integral membrane protein n=1 Tax=Paraphaeosphaeria sporulosa TaxID=1460663 RepID=A0A177CIC4_9PLEO|nr:uncharacterized protein CC84DRAFT_1174896 [Paraphaeosphaeria sporulosa]OAG07011.1 hypothetical protein CC84DRAFT_1174896 [Paraphaeosphaeria sporulosa]
MDEYPRIISMPALQGIAVTFALLALLLTLTRLVLTWRTSHRFHLDSLFSATAAFLVIPYTIGTLIDDQVQYEMQAYSVGWESSLPSLNRIERAFKTEVACTVFFWLIIYSSKATFLTIYWRMICERRAARNIWFIISSLTALFFGIIFLSVFWVCGSPGRVEACQSMGEAAATRLLTTWCVLNLVDFALLILFPLAIMPTSHTQHGKRQMAVMSAMLLLAAFFTSLDILRTYWNLTISLSDTTNLILLWRVLQPIIAAMLAALSGLANWCRISYPASDVPEDDRSWIEIGDLGKVSEA